MTLKTNILIIVMAALIVGFNLSAGAAPFPLNFNLDSLQRADKQP